MHVELLSPPSPGRLLPVEAPKVRRFAGFPLAVAAILFLTLALLFSRWNASNEWAFPKFALVTLVVLYFPGRLLTSWFGEYRSEAERTAVGTALAIVLGVMCWMALAEVGGTRWFVLWPILGTGGWLFRRFRRADPSVYVFRREHLLLAGLFAAILFSLAWIGTYYLNGVKTDEGGLEVTIYEDLRLHLAITNELRHTWPPQMSFLAGAPLRYHVGMDAFANLFLSVTSFEPLDLLNRFLPTLLFGLLALGAYSVGTQCLRSRLMAVCFAALVIFGDDFFALGRMWEPRLSPIYHMPTLNSIFFHNPNLHGLVFLFAGFAGLIRFIRKPSPRALVPAALLFAGSMLFKVFFAPHVLATLGLVGVVNWVLTRDRRMLAATLGVFAAMIPVLCLMRHALANGNTEIAIRPLPGIENPFWFFLLTLGMRLVAVPAFGRAFGRFGSPDDPRPIFAAFILIGTALSLGVHAGTLATGNNGFWFYIAGKYFLWLFALETIAWIAFAPARFGLLAATVVLAVVPTVLFIRVNSFDKFVMTAYTPADCRLLVWLRAAVPVGSVLLPEEDFALPLSAMTRCRTFSDPVLNVFSPTFSIKPADMYARDHDSNEFWKLWDVGIFREEIVARRGVAFLIVQPARHANDPLRARGVSPAYEYGPYRVYDLRTITARPPVVESRLEKEMPR